MKIHPRFLVTLLVVALVVVPACQASAPPSGGAALAPTTASNVLFEDDFSDPASGWDSHQDDEAITDYANGGYRIYLNVDNTDIWANPGKDFTDARIEVDATKVDGPDNNNFGIICRYQDVDNYYFLIISSDGFYGIGKVKDGDQSLIGMDTMPSTDDVRQGEATNRIRADCVGDTLTLYANGKLVGEAEDSDFSSGDVGLLAGTFEELGTDILFDNFVVKKP